MTTCIRLHGDPFGDGPEAARMRRFLRVARDAGLRCSLSLSAVGERPPASGENVVPLTDGVRDRRVGTRLSSAEVAELTDAAGEAVPATAPVVVFAEREAIEDEVCVAGLEWPSASVIAARRSCTAHELLVRVRAELRWAGTDPLGRGLDEEALRPWLSLPPPPEDGCIVHVGSADGASGIDLVIGAILAVPGARPRRLRLVLRAAGDRAISRVEGELQCAGVDHEIIRDDLAPRHLADAAAVLLPWRVPTDSKTFVRSLAAGRPVCITRSQATARLVDRPGVCCPIGGRLRESRSAGAVQIVEPDPSAVESALTEALGDGKYLLGARARRHVREHLVRNRPAEAPAKLRPLDEDRPLVVLEAPFFETSSSSELSIETALALQKRGNVDLRLVARVPFRDGLASLRRRAPSLECLLTRKPGRADLWLSAGWPVRAARPDCRTFALRVDWEYGALPVDLAPHVTDTADVVITHSDHVADSVAAAGRSRSSLRVVPHGVDAAIHEEAVPDPEIVRFKGNRPAVLFCGGMVWRKGFDAFVGTVLSARSVGAEFVVVIKSIGGDQHYRGFDLRELVEKVRSTPGTPPVLLVERELTRSEMASLYTGCDVLLHPYRGEGFCMPVLEARSAGLPVLATAGGATEALMAGPGAHRIPSLRRDVDLPMPCFGRPWVLEPTVACAASKLVELLGDLSAERRAAAEFAPAIRTAFSWEAAAVAIEALARNPAGLRTGKAPPAPVPRRREERVVTLPLPEPIVPESVAERSPR